MQFASFYGSLSSVGVGFSESRSITAFRAILMIASIILVFRHAKKASLL
jgi:hypothetical protein